jgi:hypothetical protein
MVKKGSGDWQEYKRQAAEQLGLNVREVSDLLRARAFPPLPAGAAHLRWPDGVTVPEGWPFPLGVLVLVQQTVRSDGQFGGWTEQGNRLHVVLVRASGESVLLEGEPKAMLLRGLLAGTVRVRPDQPGDLTRHLRDLEEQKIQELRRPSERDLEQRLRYAVTPLLAAIVSPA